MADIELIKARIEAHKCIRPDRHAKYQQPTYWGDLIVAESLNPDDYLYYTKCGLCAGFIQYVTRAEYDEHERS